MKKIKISIIGIAVVLIALTACTNRVIVPIGPGGYPGIPDHTDPDPGITVPDGGVQIGDGDAVVIDDGNLDTVLDSSTTPVAVTLGKGTYKISASTFAEKVSSLTGVGEEETVVAITEEASQPKEIAITDDASISNVTIKIGEDTALAYASLAAPAASNAADNPVVLMNVTGDNVTFDGVHIEVVGPDVSYNVIQVLGDNFTFENGSITGIPYDGTGTPLTGYFSDADDYSSVNMGIAIGSGVSNVTISNSTFEGNYTPIYSSSPDFEMTGLTFDSGIELETVSEDSVIERCEKLTNDAGYRAKINIMTYVKGQETTDYDIANEARDRFAEANPDIDEVRINDHSYADVAVNYTTLGTLNIINDIRTALSTDKTSDGMTIGSATYDSDSNTISLVLTLDDYNYASSSAHKLATGTVNVTCTAETAAAEGSVTVTSWSMDAENLTLSDKYVDVDDADEFQSFEATVTASGSIGSVGTDGRGLTFTVNGSEVIALSSITYSQDAHEFKISSGSIKAEELGIDIVLPVEL